ncbi:MAG: hypothetical protein ACRDK2_05835 [Solirubrobacteraceae bacterium]
MLQIKSLFSLKASSLLLVVAALWVFALRAPAPALASHRQITFFEAPSELLEPATRAKALGQLQALGVKALRVELYWKSVAPAPNSPNRPNFEATNPADYNWGQYSLLLAEAQRLKWPVLLTVTAPVPNWATSNHKAPYITRPKAADFKEFMTAVGHEFGSEVQYFAIWNEPNQLGWLMPQWNSNGTPASPRIYRGLYQAGYEGLQASGMSKPKVFIGETAPFGNSSIKAHKEGLIHNVSPLEFMREMLCLNHRYHKSPSCSQLPAYAYAHHPYPNAAGPFYKSPNHDDVTIGVLSRLSNALNLAARAHALPANLPIYITEFGINTKPNILGVSYAKQAEYDAISEKIAWENPRVASFAQYELRDDRVPKSFAHGGFIGFQTGLETFAGVHKPLYAGFSIPLVVSKSGHHGYSLWGSVRPASASTKVTVQVQPPHSKHFRTLKVVSTGSTGYWTLHSSTAGSHWRVLWRSPSGVTYTGPSIG